MRSLPRILFLVLGGCSADNTMVLDSDIPNVSGFDALVTRDVTRTAGVMSSVEVIYRGDVTDTETNITETRQIFLDHGWTVVSEQARGETTILNFAKAPRWATVQIALNQIDPMMSPALLRVGTGAAPGVPAPAASPDRAIGPPDGFAPAPF